MVLDGSPLAIAVFGLAALTDLLDGMLARRANKVTEFGRILDPLADRLFISSMAVALYLKAGAPPLWALMLLVGRDAVILAGSAWLRWRGQAISVTYLGKAATAVLLVAILGLVASLPAGLWLFYAGLVLYLVSGFNYLARGKKLID